MREEEDCGATGILNSDQITSLDPRVPRLFPQDTVVALQALATYESHQHQGPLQVTATVTAEGLTHSFTVNDNNKLLQQLVPLPTLPTNVTLGMEGEGCAVLQVTVPHLSCYSD